MTQAASSAPIQLLDAGANLTHDAFAKDLDEVLDAARAAGVVQLMVTGTTLAESQKARQLAMQHACLAATAGVHPHYASQVTEADYSELCSLLAEPEVLALGETGLDFNRDFSPRPVQEAVFERQLQLAAETGLPLFLHERDAHQRFYEMLLSCRDELSDLVVHCFTGSKEALFRYLDLDCHIGITGWICDERRGAHLVPLVPSIPANRLLLETDAPYLLPRDLPKEARPRSRRNEPKLLPHIAAKVAKARGESLHQLAAATTESARRFFRLAAPARQT